MAAKLHLAKNPLALHLPFQRLERLVDIVVTDENLHALSILFFEWAGTRTPGGAIELCDSAKHRSSSATMRLLDDKVDD